MRLDQVSSVNALFTVVSAVIIAILTIAHNRRISREALEQTRREWADVASARQHMNQSLKDEVTALNQRLTDITMVLGEVKKENELLRRRNIDLQRELDARHEEIRDLRADLRRLGIPVAPPREGLS